jgi:hypothetical protein
MKLEVGDRIRLLGILPEKGNLLTLKIVSKLREDLSFSEDEHKEMRILVQGDRIQWADEAKAKKITIGEQAEKIIVDTLKDLDSKEQLTMADIPLWDKFIGEEK